MLQLLNLFLVIFGVIAGGAGLFSWRSYPLMAGCLLVSGLLLIGLAYFSDRRRARGVEQRKQAAIRQRIDALTKRPINSSQTLKVGGNLRTLLAALLMALLGGILLYVGLHARSREMLPLLGGAFLLALGLFTLVRAAAGLGQPTLELGAAGFVTPFTGRIAWRDVSGIYLQRVVSRNDQEIHALLFRVQDFARVVPRVHWTDRLLAVFHLGALAKGVVSVSLPSSGEPPAAIYALARKLWTDATGNDFDWSPGRSNSYNDAIKRAQTFTSHLQEPGAMEAALADPEQMERAMAQMDRDMAMITATRKNQLKKQRWMLALLLLSVLLVVAWPWLARLLRA
ncbi:hypothetical protein PY254_17800 [Rhodanobacter sp. AS-Z3]|uniref:hypothetical protein n=1 Tax=Rhodanobacter sp. AS-Z3 TaxID=3031330 RepID=UPI0024792F6B|nr:hypothetical protein [Rhodanobacter sp. AS-Z3]WEN15057.1 hypothetical protein PY254_17800 [Rhodanobacter sp. AS-Z3]